MSVDEPKDDGQVAGPGIEELVRLVEQLDVDNERLRLRVLDLLRHMEEAVDAQVAEERRVGELEQRNRELERRLLEVEQSRIVRLTARPRRFVARVRRR